MLQPLRKNAPVGDGAVSYLEWAGARVPLNFTHANGFNAETYVSMLAPLAEGFHLFACDQRGHGFSTLPATPGLAESWTVFRDDLIAYLARISPEPVILAGHSMGATASLMAAAAAPESVSALVLFEPVLLSEVVHGYATHAIDLVARTLKRRDTFPSLAAAREAYRGRGIFKAWTDAMLDGYLRGGLKPSADGTWKLACTPAWESECFRGAPFCVSRIVNALRCPITIVHGSVNSSTFEDEIATMVDGRPDTRIVKVEGASHFLPMEFPQIVREEIERMRERLQCEWRRRP